LAHVDEKVALRPFPTRRSLDEISRRPGPENPTGTLNATPQRNSATQRVANGWQSETFRAEHAGLLPVSWTVS